MSRLIYCYAECKYAECRYAERRHAEWHCAECRGAFKKHPPYSMRIEETCYSIQYR